ncbi:MAG: dihydropteroate synthase [Chloroflexi bacterium]|nr:dihydropteroate synthase [Chloroflexota bacterium]
MIVIGECIHVIAGTVKKAIETRDKAPIQGLAKAQVDKGAHYLELNIGPQRRAGPEVMRWMVDTVREVTDSPLSLDTSNVAAMEAGLGLCQGKALVNSTDATEERLHNFMPLSAKYKTPIIALTMGKGGIPANADARLELASNVIFPSAAEWGVPVEDLFLDPLVLTVTCNQDHCQESIKAIRYFKMMNEPAPRTTCGLSNISNGAPAEVRPLLNKVFLVMMMGGGLDSAIMDPLDADLMETIRVIESRDDSTPEGELLIRLYDTYVAAEQFDTIDVDVSLPGLRDIAKTIDILQNTTVYAHSYLRV